MSEKTEHGAGEPEPTPDGIAPGPTPDGAEPGPNPVDAAPEPSPGGTEFMHRGASEPEPNLDGSGPGSTSGAAEPGSTSDKTELMPGGGRPAEASDAGEPASGTLPMPKPGPRPDDPTEPVEVGPTTDIGRQRAIGGEAADSEEPDATARRDGGASPASEGSAQPVDRASARAGIAASLHRLASRGSRRSRLVALAVIFALVIASAVALALNWDALQGGPIIPDVTGEVPASARQELEAKGFAVEERNAPTDDGVGTVLDTDPDAGQRARPGATIIVHVGVPRVIPEVRGKALEDARSALDDAGVTNLRLEYQNSDEDEGTVLSVNPGEGTVVTADAEVTLVVAQPYTVPDVKGLSQDEATAAIAKAGLESKIEWQESDAGALTVLSTSPAAGERTSAGATVTVTVTAPGARSETYLPDYLSAEPREVSAYLSWKGWSFSFGSTAEGAGSLAGTAYAETGWTKSGVGRLVFTPNPLSGSHGSFLGSILTKDVLAQGSPIAAVRFEPELGAADPQTVDTATVNTWASRAGLSGLEGTLTGDEAARAMGREVAGAPDMIMGYGEDGGNVWTVLVRKGAGVVVTCAPKGLYDGVDLAGYGNSLGVYLAYAQAFK